jgi:hypothetical protein
VDLWGTGGEVTLSNSTYPGLTFGVINLNAPSTKNVTLTNHATTSLSVSAVSTAGDFSQTNNCGGSVPGGGTCTISVTFTPTTTGERIGNLWVTDSDAASPQTLRVSGTAEGLIVSPSTLPFGKQKVNTTSAPELVTIQNLEASVVNVGTISVTGDYSQTNTCGTSIAANGKCTISVTFTPTIAGGLKGTLTITDSADDQSTVSLTGTGVN